MLSVSWLLFQPSVSIGSEQSTEARLDQNYPNPFINTTEITYGTPDNGHVTLTVYNLLGTEVQRVLDDDESANENHRIRFDGSALPSGQYTYTLVYTGNGTVSKLTHKMYLIR